MSTATELLRRALDALVEEAQYHNDIMLRWHDVFLDIRAFLAVEPEVEYDLSEVIPLTHRKSKGIIKDRGYNVTGFVLTRKDGDKCIVDMSAVRWLSGKEFFEMMHPVVTSPTAEPEANEHSISGAIAFTNGYYGGRCTVLPSNPAMVIPAGIPLYTRPEPAEPSGDYVLGEGSPYYTEREPAARKPMTEEEIEEGYADDIAMLSFKAGIRFAEKHHGIESEDNSCA